MKQTSAFDPEKIRSAIREALPETVDRAPEPRYLFVPRMHFRALSLDFPLVQGIRGAGKSVWWEALQQSRHREVVTRIFPQLHLDRLERVSAGFGAGNRPDEFPDKRALASTLSRAFSPADTWRTVVAWNTWGKEGQLGRLELWSDRVCWLMENPEVVARAFHEYDQALSRRGTQHLILFDALDRAAGTWPDLRRLLRGLLEVLLEFRGSQSIKLKAFVRPDMLVSPEVSAFPDASKLIADSADLSWSPANLYGLLFQHLGNAEQDGEEFRKGCTDLGSGEWIPEGNVWPLPARLAREENLQRRVFHELANEWMGTDQRRGFPYSWLPNHLMDALGQVSPRSFLRAVRSASEHQPPSTWRFALHYDGIKSGVQDASRIRVAEIAEDFPWIRNVMEPLAGLVMPCAWPDVQGRWESARVLGKLDQAESDEERLRPQRLADGLPGLRKDLEELGVFSLSQDGRINMPDVYRVGFGLGRRGGVRPIRAERRGDGG